MKLGIIGRGYWGDVYSKTLRKMHIPHWQAGRDWKDRSADAVIIASSPESHYSIAKQLICDGVPVVIEKPVCLESSRVKKLLKLARYRNVTVFTGHTHLFSPEWRELKKQVKDVKEINSQSGGPCKLAPLWDWGPHDVSMCIDLLGKPKLVNSHGNYLRLGWEKAFANIKLSRIKTERRFDVDGVTYSIHGTIPTPLEVLITEFLASVADVQGSGIADVDGLELAVKVVEVLETADAGNRANHDADDRARGYYGT